jgi:HEXXH motif-containing protein
VDAQTILWTDTGVYQRLYEKTATALMAVERALRARRPLGGGEDEFLALYAALAAADPDTFTIIWEDPYAYFWARFAYELLGWRLNPGPQPAGLTKYCARLGAHQPDRALALHLEEFKKFIIALSMLSGTNRRFERPLRTTLPFSIPGTSFSVLGRGTIDIVAIHSTTLEVVHNGTTMTLAADDAGSNREAPRLLRRPLVRFDDFEITLKPETFYALGAEAVQPFLDLADDYQSQHVGLLQEGLALVARYQPSALEHIRGLVQVIAFKSAASGTYSNVSFSDLPGAYILSAVRHPYWMADALIHECLHNRLFFVLDRGEILQDAEDNTERGEFYSPWRDDLRPLSGLLHAVYVFIGVGKFWFAVWQDLENSGVRRDYAEDQAVRAVLDLKIGVAQLRRYAKFTQLGIELFAEMEREVKNLATSMREMKLSPDAPAAIARADGQVVPFAVDQDGRKVSILESILAHAEKYDTRRQCADLKAILDLA